MPSQESTTSEGVKSVSLSLVDAPPSATMTDHSGSGQEDSSTTPTQFEQCASIKSRGKRCKNRARWRVVDSDLTSGNVCYGHAKLHEMRYGGTVEVL